MSLPDVPSPALSTTPDLSLLPTQASRDSAPAPRFAELGLPPRLVERLSRDGLTTTFPIQSATIPDALAGRDVLGRGQTGSGKTFAFGLPTLTRLAAGDRALALRPGGRLYRGWAVRADGAGNVGAGSVLQSGAGGRAKVCG